MRFAYFFFLFLTYFSVPASYAMPGNTASVPSSSLPINRNTVLESDQRAFNYNCFVSEDLVTTPRTYRVTIRGILDRYKFVENTEITSGSGSATANVQVHLAMSSVMDQTRLIDEDATGSYLESKYQAHGNHVALDLGDFKLNGNLYYGQPIAIKVLGRDFFGSCFILE